MCQSGSLRVESLQEWSSQQRYEAEEQQRRQGSRHLAAKLWMATCSGACSAVYPSCHSMELSASRWALTPWTFGSESQSPGGQVGSLQDIDAGWIVVRALDGSLQELYLSVMT